MMNIKDAFVAFCWLAAIVIAALVVFDVIDAADQANALALAIAVGFIGSVVNKFVTPA